jgi:hypothetical protein
MHGRDNRIWFCRQESVKLVRTPNWIRLGDARAGPLSQDASKSEERPVFVQRKQNYIFFSAIGCAVP